jgi:hypothetical protein
MQHGEKKHALEWSLTKPAKQKVFFAGTTNLGQHLRQTQTDKKIYIKNCSLP